MQIDSKTGSFKNIASSSSNDPRTKRVAPVESQQQPEEETELLSHLDEGKLTKIKNEFLKEEEGLELNQFLEVMLNHLEYSKEEELKITIKLIDLFKEIDVNGDQHLEW